MGSLADMRETADVVDARDDERRDDVRVLISVPGRYMLANKRNAQGNRCEFACRVVNMSTRAMALAAPVVGQPGERVIVYTEHFGKLHGAIVRLIPNGFAMSIAAPPEERDKLRAKLVWLSKLKESPDMPDGRRHVRIVPRNPMGTIMLADGSTISCLVIDFSDSGAAVSADYYPEVGTPLAVGKMIGRVVRRFPEGFAVEFTGNESLAEVERKLAGSRR
jgi:hypothetical protein